MEIDIFNCIFGFIIFIECLFTFIYLSTDKLIYGIINIVLSSIIIIIIFYNSIKRQSKNLFGNFVTFISHVIFIFIYNVSEINDLYLVDMIVKAIIIATVFYFSIRIRLFEDYTSIDVYTCFICYIIIIATTIFVSIVNKLDYDIANIFVYCIIVLMIINGCIGLREKEYNEPIYGLYLFLTVGGGCNIYIQNS